MQAHIESTGRGAQKPGRAEGCGERGGGRLFRRKHVCTCYNISICAHPNGNSVYRGDTVKHPDNLDLLSSENSKRVNGYGDKRLKELTIRIAHATALSLSAVI